MNLSKRKSTRLKGYDYSLPGVYFVTICTKDREQLLSRIIVGDGVLDVPKNILTGYGQIAKKHLENMCAFYDYINLKKYVIMPNHIHILIEISNCKQYGSSGTPNPTNSLIPRFVSTFKRFCNSEYTKNIWQRSFHDHIIRDEEDFLKIWKYIDENPLKWEEDCFYN